MKKLVIISLFLFSLQICFSQNQKIKDLYSGLETELSANNDYLIVTNIKTGSPADLVSLKLGDRIYKINDKSVSEISDVQNYFLNNNDNWLKINTKSINETISIISIPRMSIDFFSDKYAAESELFNILSPEQYVSFRRDVSTDLEKFQNLESIVQTSENPKAYRIHSYTDSKGCTYSLKKNINKYTQITTLVDRDKNFEKFGTYDFEYISQEDPLMEKTLLNDLSLKLNELGLKREQANPDILILISFYSGQKEQYVPPQQIVSTRIQNYFNWYWGYIPVPVTESKTKEGYTKSTFLVNINLKFLDAKEIPNSKIPPIIWSSSFSEVSTVKTFLSDYSKEIFKYLLLQFPIVVDENCENLIVNTYTFTGVIYDKDNLPIIADVIPESPAYKAGLRKNDEIVKINGRKISDNISSNVVSMNRNGFQNALRYLFINSDFKDDDLQLFRSLHSEFEDYKNFDDKSLIYDIKRNGKKMSLSVKPEFKKVIFFDKLGFNID